MKSLAEIIKIAKNENSSKALLKQVRQRDMKCILALGAMGFTKMTAVRAVVMPADRLITQVFEKLFLLAMGAINTIDYY